MVKFQSYSKKLAVFNWYRTAEDGNPMRSRNQNKPPVLHSSVDSNQAVDDEGKQELGMINDQKDVTEWEIVEFTKEEVDDLFNDKFQGKAFDSKGKHEWMIEYIKQLKFCLKWFQNGLEDCVKEKDHLQTMLEFSEKKYMEAEAAMKTKEEEFDSTISKLENNISSLKQSLTNEESQKLDAIASYNEEKEVTLALQKDQDYLNEKLSKSMRYLSTANAKVEQQEGLLRKLHEYNTSLQHYNCQLENELKIATDVLRGELEQLREECDHYVSQVQVLNAEIAQYEKNTEDSAALCKTLSLKSSDLEETCSAQTEQISRLQYHLNAATQKLKMANLSTSEIITKCEFQNRYISELEDQLWKI